MNVTIPFPYLGLGPRSPWPSLFARSFNALEYAISLSTIYTWLGACNEMKLD